MFKKLISIMLCIVILVSTSISALASGNSLARHSVYDGITIIHENSFVVDRYLVETETDRMGNLHSVTISRNGTMLERATITSGVIVQKDFRTMGANRRMSNAPVVQEFRIADIVSYSDSASNVVPITPHTTGNIGSVRYQVIAGQRRLNFNSVRTSSVNLAGRTVNVSNGMLWGTLLAAVAAAVGAVVTVPLVAAIIGGLGFFIGQNITATQLVWISGSNNNYLVTATDPISHRRVEKPGSIYQGRVRNTTTGRYDNRTSFSGHDPNFIARRGMDVAVSWFNYFWFETFSVIW